MSLFNRNTLSLIASVGFLAAFPISVSCAADGTPDPAQNNTSAPISTSDAAGEEHQKIIGIRRVEANQICMMNNTYMGKEQISVLIDGKTYYGCCPMCKEKLKNDPLKRQAADPISGKIVDKATAVLGAAPDDAIYYFENEENLQKFSDEPSRYIKPDSIEP